MDTLTETESPDTTQSDNRERDMEVLELLCERYNLKVTSPESVCLWPSTVVQIKEHLDMFMNMLRDAPYPYNRYADSLASTVETTIQTIQHVIDSEV